MGERGGGRGEGERGEGEREREREGRGGGGSAFRQAGRGGRRGCWRRGQGRRKGVVSSPAGRWWLSKHNHLVQRAQIEAVCGQGLCAKRKPCPVTVAETEAAQRAGRGGSANVAEAQPPLDSQARALSCLFNDATGEERLDCSKHSVSHCERIHVERLIAADRIRLLSSARPRQQPACAHSEERTPVPASRATFFCARFLHAAQQRFCADDGGDEHSVLRHGRGNVPKGICETGPRRRWRPREKVQTELRRHDVKEHRAAGRVAERRPRGFETAQLRSVGMHEGKAGPGLRSAERSVSFLPAQSLFFFALPSAVSPSVMSPSVVSPPAPPPLPALSAFRRTHPLHRPQNALLARVHPDDNLHPHRPPLVDVTPSSATEVKRVVCASLVHRVLNQCRFARVVELASLDRRVCRWV